MREAHGKSAAKSAALLGFTEGDDLNAFDGFQKLHGCRSARCATRVAGSVKSDASLESAGPFLDSQTIHEIVGDLPCATGQIVDRAEVGFLLEFEWGAMEKHRRTGARWNNDGFITFKYIGGVAHHLAGGCPVTAVEGRLAAAGLVFWKFNFAASVLEDFDRSLGHIVKKSVAETGGHELDLAAIRFGDGWSHVLRISICYVLALG